jgi:hypothetical protein
LFAKFPRHLSYRPESILATNWVSTLILEYVPEKDLPKWVAHLRAVHLAAAIGKAHDAFIRHGRIISNNTWAYKRKQLQL